jgi:UPF0271 protein
MHHLSIDINCDMGEGMGNESYVMPFISSANIACGGHAGNADSIKRTIEIAQKNNVAIGAHPSYIDRENFGRVSQFISVLELAELIADQYYQFEKIANQLGAPIHHVKLHGALYNDCAKDALLSKTFIQTIQAIDPTLIIYGLSGSHTIQESIMAGQPFFREAFADRTYQNNGQLTPRYLDHAIIDEVEQVINQVISLIQQNKVISIQGDIIDLKVDTICIHGDGPNAIAFSESIFEALKTNHIEIKKY